MWLKPVQSGWFDFRRNYRRISYFARSAIIEYRHARACPRLSNAEEENNKTIAERRGLPIADTQSLSAAKWAFIGV